MSESPDPDERRLRAEISKATAAERGDLALGLKLARHRDHPVAKAAGAASKVGDQGPLYAISAGLLIYGVLSGKRRLAGSGLAMLPAIALADLVKSGVKNCVSRTRPHVLLDDGRYEIRAGASDEKTEQSFPSGHTVGSVAVARALSRVHPQAGAAAGAAAVAIGIARIAKGSHWPLDVLGGAIIGLAVEFTSTTLVHFAWISALKFGGLRQFPWLVKVFRAVEIPDTRASWD